MASDHIAETNIFIKISRPQPVTYECAVMLRIGPTEFIAISDYIYKYSSTDAEWCRLRLKQELPRFDSLRQKMLCSVDNEMPHRLYIAYGWRIPCKVMYANLMTKTLTNYLPCNIPIDTMISVGDNIHMFGIQSDHTQKLKHCVFDFVTGGVLVNASTDEHVIGSQLRQLNRSLFCKSRESILIGCSARDRDGMGKGFSFLMEYSLNTKQYQQLEWTVYRKFGMFGSSMLSTLDERYTVVFAFDEGSILVYDLWKKRVFESDIRCPAIALCGAVLLGSNERDELAMFGFVRKVFRATELKDVAEIPIHVMQLMSKWYCNEQVHLIDSYHDDGIDNWHDANDGRDENNEDDSHWTVDMDQIIQSVSQ